jgi:nucleoside permease NupC
MTESRALALILLGTMLLSGAVNAVLLKMGVPGELLAVAMVAIVAVTGIPVTRVMNHYEAQEQRREREAKLTFR